MIFFISQPFDLRGQRKVNATIKSTEKRPGEIFQNEMFNRNNKAKAIHTVLHKLLNIKLRFICLNNLHNKLKFM